MCGSVLRVTLQDALRAHRSAAGVALKEKRPGLAELGFDVIRLGGEDAPEAFQRLIQMKLIKARMTIQQQQRGVVRRVMKGFAEGLES